MGIADSPLRDRVVFVMGAPRSGTTWLATVLAVHPAIAGILSESHLFDRGVDRLFDNHEGAELEEFLAGYLSRTELADLVRDLCDGVLTKVRERVKPGARLVMEKTPVGMRSPELHVARKVECYPDAWYLHIVRDEAAVVESFDRMPWTQEIPPAERARVWQTAVGAIREGLQDHPRYREVTYEDVVADPRKAAGAIFGWLGVDEGDDVLDRVVAVSREHHAPHKRPSAGTRARIGWTSIERSLRAAAKRALRRDGAANTKLAPLAEFLGAFGNADERALHALTSDGFELTFRSPAGDIQVNADGAREALTKLANEVFAEQGFVSQSWSVSHEDLHGVWFSGIRGDASRVDLCVAVRLANDRVVSATVISGGDPRGRMSTDWTA